MKRCHAKSAAALAEVLAWALVASGAAAAAPNVDAPTAAVPAAPVWWRAPAASTVPWRGMLETDGGSVGSGTQIGPYPVAGAAGLLVAVLTHAAISQTAQASERQRAQEAADRVLAPHQAALQAWPAERLWASAAPLVAGLRLWTDTGTPAAGASIETLPVYTLSQDGSALQLDVAVTWTPGGTTAARRLSLRVVSAPQIHEDAAAYWQANESTPLKATAAALLAHAVQLALQHAETPVSTETMRTHRYLHGKAERAERAERLGGDCARVVLRNLRGWLVSVPVRQAEGSTCEATASLTMPSDLR